MIKFHITNIKYSIETEDVENALIAKYGYDDESNIPDEMKNGFGDIEFDDEEIEQTRWKIEDELPVEMDVFVDYIDEELGELLADEITKETG